MKGVIDTREEIDALVAFSGRGPGTDAERRAAQHLRARLEEIGRDADAEPSWIRPNWPLAYAGYAMFGVGGRRGWAASGIAGAIIAGVAFLAALADLSGRF